MQETIFRSAEEAVRAASMLKEPASLRFMEQTAEALAQCFREGHKVLIAGNGGSLCDAMHFAEEFTGQFRKPRPALAAIALADPGHMSCVGNDMGFEQIFARSVEALGQAGDVLIVMTTSGNSVNLVRAVHMAKSKGLTTIAFLGKTGGQMKGLCDLEWIVSGFAYSDRIQEAHMAAGHIIIERVEQCVFCSTANV